METNEMKIDLSNNFCEYDYHGKAECAKQLSETVANYSKKIYGKYLCWAHQALSEKKDEGFASTKDFEESVAL